MGCFVHKNRTNLQSISLEKYNAPSPAPIAIGIETGTICIALLTLLLILEMI